MDPAKGSPAPASGSNSGSDGKSPATADTEGTLGSDGGSDGGSFLLFKKPAELSGKEAGPAEAITGDGVGLSFSGSSVLAGATGSSGTDAGLAGSVGGTAGSATVVGSAGIERAVEVGSSITAGVNAIGGSKIARVVSPAGSVYIPIHTNAYVGLRENTLIGGMTIGRYGGPIVVITVPSMDVLNPKPQVGQARSFILIGAIPTPKSMSL